MSGGVSKIISELVKVIKYVEDALSNVPQLFMGGPGTGADASKESV